MASRIRPSSTGSDGGKHGFVSGWMKKDYQSSLIVGLALTLGLLIAAFFGYSAFLAWDAKDMMVSKLPSGSMEPTLLLGDYFTSTRLGNTRTAATLRRGDVVIFLWPEDTTKQFVKRLIGLPGDTIAMKDAVVTLNGRTLREPYATMTDSVDPVVDDFRWQRRFLVGQVARATSHYVASRNNWGPLLVPANRYFVLGDRRDASLDSRYFGFVPASEIVGHVRRVYFSRDTNGVIRWSRIGHLVR